MASSKPYTVKWGILATGGIAKVFTRDLLTNPATRNVHDVQHIVAAVASSSSLSRATEFIGEVKAPSTAKAYGSYHELVNAPDIDIIYVATPHSHHFQNVMLALEAGKNVLCEKAFTVNAAQTKKLVATAKAKKLFLMEGVWTRFFPLSIKIRELVTSGVIGDVHRVTADLSMSQASEDGGILFPDSHRMVNPDLAGGALLDLGVYPLTWVFQILYHCQPKPREKPKVMAAIQKYEKTGVDEMTSLLLQFPGQKSMGFATTSMRVGSTQGGEGKASVGPACRIQGTKGEIQVMEPLFQPTRYRVIMAGDKEKVEEVHCPQPQDNERDGVDNTKGWGHGFMWEQDEIARCLRDGKLECETLSWEESITIMETMDEARKQGDLKYPELIETDIYDEKSPLNGK